MRQEKELPETLKRAFGSDTAKVQELAEAAGLPPASFPDRANSASEMWDQVVRDLERLGKLRALVTKAATDAENERDQNDFNRIGLAMRVREELVTMITRSGLLRAELLRLYRESLSEDQTSEDVTDPEEIIFTLWGYSDRRALLNFMLRVAEKTTNLPARGMIHDWYNHEDTPKLLSLPRSDLDFVRQGAEQPREPRRRYLMTVVEPLQPDESGAYFVSLYLGVEGKTLQNFGARKKVPVQDLERYVVAELEKAFLKYAPLDSNSPEDALHTIEFYLPSSLLAIPVEPHLWNVSQKSLVRQCMVVIGITERHLALSKAKMIQKTKNERELKSMLRRLQKDSRMFKLIKGSRFWVQRWNRLNMESEKLLDTIVGPVDRDAVTSLERLKTLLEEKEEWAGLAFAFAPFSVEGEMLEALLDQVFGAGMPIILWTYEPEQAGDGQDTQQLFAAIYFEREEQGYEGCGHGGGRT